MLVIGLSATRVTVAPSGLTEVAAEVEQGITWLPRAEDDDAGFYVAAGGAAGWRAAAILRAADSVSYEEIAYLDAPAILGTC